MSTNHRPPDQSSLPWTVDPPDGCMWECPDCGTQSKFGEIAAYHATVKVHAMPRLVKEESYVPILFRAHYPVYLHELDGLTKFSFWHHDIVLTFNRVSLWPV